METIENKTFDEERALYGCADVMLVGCSFDGARDGESALKEARNIKAEACYINLRYPFWHDDKIEIDKCGMSDKCRAPLWYSTSIKITESVMNGTKALRECDGVSIDNTVINSAEFGWFSKDIKIKDSQITSEYCMLKAGNISKIAFSMY